MTDLGPATTHRTRARPLAFALLAVFWVAQLSGLAHGISHFSASPGLEGLAPHTLVCTSCAAAADSGAAPVLAAADCTATPFLRIAPQWPPPAVSGREPVADYQSRAPPAAPI